MGTPATPSDPARRTLMTPGGPVAYTDEGDPRSGRVFVLLHGLPGSARDWRWLAPPLSRGARVIRLEQPGFGGTSLQTQPDPDLEVRARWVDEALEALGVTDCVLVGHSMGGALAMVVAARAPQRLSGLALLASVGLRPHVSMRRRRPSPALGRWLGFAPLRLALRPSLRRGFARAGFSAELPYSSLVHTLRILASFSFASLRRSALTITAPTFLAWAEDDPFIEPVIGMALATELPDGPRLTFASGGHNIQKSRALELSEALLSFAAR